MAEHRKKPDKTTN